MTLTAEERVEVPTTGETEVVVRLDCAVVTGDVT